MRKISSTRHGTWIDMEEPRLGVVEEKWRGRSSVAEHQLPKLSVVGSIPIARSNVFNMLLAGIVLDVLQPRS